MELTEKIKSLASHQKEEIIAIRRHIHSRPELSFEEKETAAFISSQLKTWGIAHQTGIGGEGIVGLIKGDEKNQGSKVIALRAELDALPITEKNDVPYQSTHPGVMHACGHDVHAAALLGAIKILHLTKNEWNGAVKFFFQPGEEKLPGGASKMIAAGVLQNPAPDWVIAQHVYTPLKVGTAGFRSGMYMASADEIYIVVKGKGGHAAEPMKVINPLFSAGRLLVELEKLSKELAASSVPTVFTFGKISGAGATNIIPEEVTIDGTLRTMEEGWRKQIHSRIRQLIADFSIHEKTEIAVRIEVGYPCLVNDEEVTAAAKSFAEEYLGKKNIVDLDLRMASEDFAFYSQVAPVCFYRIGTGNPEKGITSGVHTPTFNIDEEALEIAGGLMAYIAIRQLQR